MTKDNDVKTAWNTPFIAQRADPYILHHEERYYFTASVPEYDRIILRCSPTLEGLRTAEEKVIWHAHDAGVMSRHIWAPEIHFIDGKWIIYFAAGENPDIWKIRPWVLGCDGDPMTDEWKEMGQLEPADEFTFQGFSLDMTTFAKAGRRFNVWAEKVSVGKMISNLYIAETDGAMKYKTPQMLLVSPTYDWERVGFWVDEGPAFMEHEGKIFMAFSSSSTGPAYCVGLMWADVNADLMDISCWHKVNHPVLVTDEEKGLFGPGHNSFFKDDNGDWCMAYHARPYDEIVGDSLYDPNRHCYILKVQWQDGMPVFDFNNQLFQ